MFIIITTKKHREICHRYYEMGIRKGWELHKELEQSKRIHKGVIISPEVDAQIDKILRGLE